MCTRHLRLVWLGVTIAAACNAGSGETRDATTFEAAFWSGLGTSAAYIDVPGSAQTLNVRFKEYLVSLRTTAFTSDVPESALQPLAVKVMGQL